MTPKQKHDFVSDRVEYWRDRLDLPRGLKLKIKTVTHREDDGSERLHGMCHMDMMPYKKATIEFYDELFAEKNFKEEAEKAVFHELMHLVLYPMRSFVTSLTKDGQTDYYTDLEEHLITTLEDALLVRVKGPKGDE